MEYSYKVYLKDKSVKLISLDALQGKELDSYDRFSRSPDFNNLLEANGINNGMISKITILGKSADKEYEYKLIGDNPYFNDVFYYIKDQETNTYGKKHVEKIINDESENFKEMRSFVFEELREEPEIFINDIYYHNPNNTSKFVENINKYGIAIKSNLNEEDEHNIYELESTIRKQLSVYKTYRSVATRRYEYEKRKQLERELEEQAMLRQLPPREEPSLEPDYEQLVDDYNKKYDEFIEENEYSMMTGDDSEAKVR